MWLKSYQTTFCLIASVLIVLQNVLKIQAKSMYPHLQCRDPGVGYGNERHTDRKFLIISGKGGGIGNYLIFYPAAYYFAAMTGRDIIILDNSLIGEMCNVIHCGFPMYSTVQKAYPAFLENSDNPKYKYLKIWDFRRHLWHEALIEDRVAFADGYKFFSGWYAEHNYSTWCISHLTGCKVGDTSCEDRHAYQQLIRGPFQRRIEDSQFVDKYLVGVPQNLKQAMLSLPHAMAPRLDFALHLRCQFRHFEYLVGPEDNLWPQHQQEISDFLLSEDYNAGEQLFREIAQKLQEEISHMLQQRILQRQQQQKKTNLRQRKLALLSPESANYNSDTNSKNNAHNSHNHVKRSLKLDIAAENASAMVLESLNEQVNFFSSGQDEEAFHVYLASDNEDVKTAFAHYLVHHLNAYFNTTSSTASSTTSISQPKVRVSVMRVHTGKHIAHAKDIGWLKSEASGVFTLIADWYALSLANTVIAWRRDTNMLSTFAQSAQRFSGNSQLAEGGLYAHTPFDIPDTNNNIVKEEMVKRGKGFQLVTIKGRAHWNEF